VAVDFDLLLPGSYQRPRFATPLLADHSLDESTHFRWAKPLRPKHRPSLVGAVKGGHRARSRRIRSSFSPRGGIKGAIAPDKDVFPTLTESSVEAAPGDPLMNGLDAEPA
jgi:hypothetical protein